MSDFQNEHHESPIFDPADSTIMSNSIAPQFTFLAFEGFAETPRILGRGYSVSEVIDNPNFNRTIQLT